MKKWLLVLIIVPIGMLSLSAQNLVLNPSFEDTIICTQFSGPPQMVAQYWFEATNGSVDYFSETNTCYTYTAPASSFGYQYPRTGNAYFGIGIYNHIPIPNYREYLEGTLFDTLIQGHTYCVSFYVVKADSGKYYTDDIGLYFSVDSTTDYSTALNLNYTPQINNINGIIYDTLNWSPIAGSYLAQGGEKFITIGNFKNDSNTTLDSNNQVPNSNTIFAYYFIDDVSVIDCTTGISEIKNQQIAFIVSPNPVKNKLTIQLQNSKEKITAIEIVNTLGGIVLKEQLSAPQAEIDITAFSRGIYFVKVFTDHGVGVKKFVKE